MATLVENAIRIKQTFDDICDAIVEQGVTPTGGVDTYADAINNIDISSVVRPEQVVIGVSQAYGTANASFNSTTEFLIGFSYNISSGYFSYNTTTKALTCLKDGICVGELGIYQNSTSGPADESERYTSIYKNNEKVLSQRCPTQFTTYATLGATLFHINAGDTIVIKGANRSSSSKSWGFIFRAAFYYIAV